MTKEHILNYERCVHLIPELKGLELSIKELKGGITNKLYRVSASDGKDYVFRIYGQKTEMFIDRDVESKNMMLMGPLGITPKLVKYIPKENVTIIEFIHGYTLKNEDFLKENLWESIIRPIKIVHKSGVGLPKLFDPIVEVKKLYNILKDINSHYPEFKIQETIEILEKIDEIVNIPHSKYLPCHNDLLADNFMLTEDRKKYKEPMYLIDWEYTGMSTWYYDIADMFQEILVPRDVERNLLMIYCKNKDVENNVYMIDMFKPFPDIYWFLWSLIQLNISSIDFDYYNYGKVKYINTQKNINYLRNSYNVKI